MSKQLFGVPAHEQREYDDDDALQLDLFGGTAEDVIVSTEPTVPPPDLTRQQTIDTLLRQLDMVLVNCLPAHDPYGVYSGLGLTQAMLDTRKAVERLESLVRGAGGIP